MSIPILLFMSLSLVSLQEPAGSEGLTVLAREGVHVLKSAFVEEAHLWVPVSALSAISGFRLKPEGLCVDEICVPLPGEGAGPSWTRERAGVTFLDASAFAEHVGQAVTHSADGGVWSLGPVPLLRSPLLQGQAPDFELLDRDGDMVRLSDFRGSKVLLLTWASW